MLLDAECRAQLPSTILFDLITQPRTDSFACCETHTFRMKCAFNELTRRDALTSVAAAAAATPLAAAAAAALLICSCCCNLAQIHKKMNVFNHRLYKNTLLTRFVR